MKWFKKKLTARNNTVSAYHMVGAPQWTPKRYDRLVDEGFCGNVLVYRCVNLIAQGIASIPLKNNKVAILQQPNPAQDWLQFIEALVTSYLLSGNAYIQALADDTSTLQELHILRADRVTIRPGHNSLPMGYLYTVGAQKQFIPLTKQPPEICHLKTYHPLNDWYGLSPIEAAAKAIDQHNAVSGHNLALLQNGGRPSGAFIVDTQMTHLSDNQRQELRDNVDALFHGLENTGRPLVLEGAFRWQEMGMTPKDLDFIEGKKISGREIAQAFGVPPMLIGITGDATFSNFKEARLHLWEDTILPLGYKIMHTLSRWLMNWNALSEPMQLNLDKVPALQPKRNGLWERMQAADFLTDDEKRQFLGLNLQPESRHEK